MHRERIIRLLLNKTYQIKTLGQYFRKRKSNNSITLANCSKKYEIDRGIIPRSLYFSGPPVIVNVLPLPVYVNVKTYEKILLHI